MDFFFSNNEKSNHEIRSNNESEFSFQNLPIAATRKINIINMGDGQTIVHDQIIVETFPSLSTIFLILSYILFIGTVLQLLYKQAYQYKPRVVEIFTCIILFFFPPILAIFFKMKTLLLYFLVIFSLFIGILIIKSNRKMFRYSFFVIQTIFTIHSLVAYIIFVITLVQLYLMKNILNTLYYLVLVLYSSLFLKDILIEIAPFFKVQVISHSIDSPVCLLCKGELKSSLRLNCGHIYHSNCIRGYIYFLRKPYSPCCNNKIDYNMLGERIYEKSDRFFNRMIDILRSFVLISMVFVGGLFYIKYKYGGTKIQ